MARSRPHDPAPPSCWPPPLKQASRPSMAFMVGVRASGSSATRAGVDLAPADADNQQVAPTDERSGARR